MVLLRVAHVWPNSDVFRGRKRDASYVETGRQASVDHVGESFVVFPDEINVAWNHKQINH